MKYAKNTISMFMFLMITFMWLCLMCEMMYTSKVVEQNRRLTTENATMKLALQKQGYYFIDQKTYEAYVKGKFKTVILWTQPK